MKKDIGYFAKIGLVIGMTVVYSFGCTALDSNSRGNSKGLEKEMQQEFKKELEKKYDLKNDFMDYPPTKKGKSFC